MFEERGNTTIWQPSDPDSGALESIAGWIAGLPTVRPPITLDVQHPWPALRGPPDATGGAAGSLESPAAIFCANMVHISPWACTLALLDGAARALPGGKLFLYGPFRRGGFLVPSNLDFDAWLKARDPAFGVRDLEAVESAATGFTLEEIVEMPANNLLTVWGRMA